jgi:hypothetical protein
MPTSLSILCFLTAFIYSLVRVRVYFPSVLELIKTRTACTCKWVTRHIIAVTTCILPKDLVSALIQYFELPQSLHCMDSYTHYFRKYATGAFWSA